MLGVPRRVIASRAYRDGVRVADVPLNEIASALAHPVQQ
jgi:hypothetical protein